jgi:hypothetical protein
MLSELVEPFVAQYDALAMGAEEEDRDILNYVAAHERALADYSRLALQDRGAAALAPVLALLPPGG